jgi:hypothetical protein
VGVEMEFLSGPDATPIATPAPDKSANTILDSL